MSDRENDAWEMIEFWMDDYCPPGTSTMEAAYIMETGKAPAAATNPGEDNDE